MPRWQDLRDGWLDGQAPQPRDVADAWDALWDAKPREWAIGQPRVDPDTQHWPVEAVLLDGSAGSVTAEAATGALCIVELAGRLPHSRNQMLASLSRRLGICEERGSGVEKVVFQLELYQLQSSKRQPTRPE